MPFLMALYHGYHQLDLVSHTLLPGYNGGFVLSLVYRDSSSGAHAEVVLPAFPRVWQSVRLALAIGNAQEEI